MGLDMSAVRRVSTMVWDLTNDKQDLVEIEPDGTRVFGVASDRILEIEESVMDWRKANHIHAWFVKNVQDGTDDCKSYHVSWTKLRELLAVCRRVLKASVLVDGEAYAGTVYDSDHPNGLVKREAGRVIKDDTVARELLPRAEGFFFGNQEYDEDYLEDVKATHDWIVRMLADYKNGEPGQIYYSSSW
jgi:hypothetical protein